MGVLCATARGWQAMAMRAPSGRMRGRFQRLRVLITILRKRLLRPEFLTMSEGGFTKIGHHKHAAAFAAHLRAAKLEDARHALDEAVELAERTGEQFYVPELWRMRGEMLVRTSRRSDAEQCLRTAIAVARRQGARLFELRAAIALYDSRIRLPRALRGARRRVGRFPVNLHPKCLDPQVKISIVAKVVA